MRVLYVCELASPHSARWVAAASAVNIESALFQASCGPTEMSEELRSYRSVVYTAAPVEGLWNQKSLFPDQAELDSLVQSEGFYPEKYADFLVAAIEEVQPDVIHVLGLCVNFRNSTRVLVAAHKKRSSRFPKIVYSSWGADLDFYPKQCPGELKSIEEFLSIADFHISECGRDIRLAREFGFRGRILGLAPANGGIDPNLRLLGSACERSLILIKGRDESDGDPVGRGLQILEAVEAAANELSRFRILVLQASRGTVVRRRAFEIAKKTGLKIEILPHVVTSELYQLLAHAHVFVANTINDGLPLSLVEAMALGAYPIHSDLESIRDYIVSGENGILVPIDDPDQNLNAIVRALKMVAMAPEAMERARQKNFELVRRRLAVDVVRENMIRFYRSAGGWKPEIARRRRVWRQVRLRATVQFQNGLLDLLKLVFRLVPPHLKPPLRKLFDKIRRFGTH